MTNFFSADLSLENEKIDKIINHDFFSFQNYLNLMNEKCDIDKISFFINVLEKSIIPYGVKDFIFEIYQPSRGIENNWNTRCFISNLNDSVSEDLFLYQETKNITLKSYKPLLFKFNNIIKENENRMEYNLLIIPIYCVSGEISALTLFLEQKIDMDLFLDKLINVESLIFIANHFHQYVRTVLIEKMLICGSKRKRTLLSNRETTILEWTAKGKSSEEIASILGISKKSVEFHIEGCKRKLNVFNRTHAVTKAILLGLLLFSNDS